MVRLVAHLERAEVARAGRQLAAHLKESKAVALQTTQKQAQRLMIASSRTHEALAGSDLTAAFHLVTLMTTYTVNAWFLHVALTHVMQAPRCHHHRHHHRRRQQLIRYLILRKPTLLSIG